LTVFTDGRYNFCHTIADICKAGVGISKNLSDLQKARWDVLAALAKDGKLARKDIREIAYLITETEREETRNWTEVIRIAIKATVVVVIAVVVAVIRKVGKKEG